MFDLSVPQNREGGCPACHHTDGRLFGIKSGHEQWECGHCGCIVASGQTDEAEVRALYGHYYDQARFETPPVVVSSLRRLVTQFEPFRQTERLLDIGYGAGGLLEIAESHGWECYGADIAPQSLYYGEKRGWIVTSSPDNDPRFPAQGFDVITMIEFIEHAQQPADFFRMAKRLLPPGGLLYLTTPNAASLNRRLLGLEWSVFSPPEHMTIWTVKGLSEALAEVGLRCQRARTEGFNPYEIITRWRPRQQAGQELSRNQAGLALNTALSSSPLRRALKAGINQCLSAIRVGDSLKVWAINQSE